MLVRDVFASSQRQQNCSPVTKSYVLVRSVTQFNAVIQVAGGVQRKSVKLYTLIDILRKCTEIWRLKVVRLLCQAE
jgi:hypothetical protein